MRLLTVLMIVLAILLGAAVMRGITDAFTTAVVGQSADR